MTDQHLASSSSINSASVSSLTNSMLAELTPRDVLEWLNDLIHKNKLLREQLAECMRNARTPQSQPPDPPEGEGSHAPESESTQDPSQSQSASPAYSVSDSVQNSLIGGPAQRNCLSTLDGEQSSTVQPVQAQTSCHEVEVSTVRSALCNWYTSKSSEMELGKLVDQQKGSLSRLQAELKIVQDERRASGRELAALKSDMDSVRMSLQMKEHECKELTKQVNEMARLLDIRNQAEAESRLKIEDLQKHNNELQQKLESQRRQLDSTKQQTEVQAATTKADKGKMQSVINRLCRDRREEKSKKAAEIKALNERNEQLEDKVSAATEQVLELEQRHAEMVRELSQSSHKVSSAMVEQEALRAKNVQLLADIDALRKALAQVEQSQSSREQSSAMERLQAENRQLLADSGTLREALAQEKQRYDESSSELNCVKDQLAAARSAENERVRQEKNASVASLCQEEQRYAERMHELQEQLEAQKAENEKLRASMDSASMQADQSAEIRRLRRLNNDLSLKLDELQRSRNSLMEIVHDPTKPQVALELHGQIDELRGLLVASEGLVKTQGERITDLNRQLEQRVERSPAYVALKSRLATVESSLQEEQKAREKASSESQALSQSISELQAQLKQTTAELEALQLEDIRRRHSSVPVTPALVSPTSSMAAGAVGPLRGPTSFALAGGAPGSQQLGGAASQGYARLPVAQPRQSVPNRLQPPRGGSAAAGGTLQRPGRATTSIHTCPYCAGDMPDKDSLFVHLKDCLRKPADYDS